VAGNTGARIYAPIRPPGPWARRLARLWPWPLVAFLGLLAGPWAIGAVAHDLLMRSAYLVPALVLVLLAATVASGLAHDRRAATPPPPPSPAGPGTP
jgi:hypothetical protein